METAAANAVLSVDLYVSSFTFFGGINGLYTNGDIKFFPGVNTCSSGILCTSARYSFFAGSITRNGIPWSFQRRSNNPTEKVVLPEPGVPTTNICFARSFREIPILSPLEDDFSTPISISTALIILSAYVLLDFPASFTGSPADTRSLPTGRRNNSQASSAVIIYGSR